jgi:hypothetical protein
VHYRGQIEIGRNSVYRAFSVLFIRQCLGLPVLTSFVVECWGMNELVYCIVHLTKIFEKVVEVLAVYPLVFLFEELYVHLCEVGAILKTVD